MSDTSANLCFWKARTPAKSAMYIEVIQGNQVILQFESGMGYEAGGLFLLLLVHSTIPQDEMWNWETLYNLTKPRI